MIRQSKYVDDLLTGGVDAEHCVDLEFGVNAVANHGSFSYKPAIKSGDQVEPTKVLGVIWAPREDTLKVNCTVNISKKHKGAKTGPNMDFDDIQLPDLLTRRIIWRACMGPFDPFGLLSPIIVQLKMVMKKLATLDLSANGWDEPISDDASATFIKACHNLAGASHIPFPRCVVAKKAIGRPQLLVFVDGSLLAICTAAYIRWELPDHQWKSFLVAAKCKVAPKLAVTVPRMELMAAQIGTRLATKIRESMVDLKFKETLFFTDSSAVLGMLQAPSGSISIFAGHRVSEVKINSESSRWLWVPTAENIADLGTRCLAKPADLGPKSVWQNGPEWVDQHEDTWPTKTDFRGDVPAAESKPSSIVLAVSSEPAVEPEEAEVLQNPQVEVSEDAQETSSNPEDVQEIFRSTEDVLVSQDQQQPKSENSARCTHNNMRTVANKGWFPIEDFSSFRRAKNVLVKVLMVTDGCMARKHKRPRLSVAELRKNAHIHLMSSCQNIDQSVKGLNLVKNLSPSIATLPVGPSTTATVVVMNSRIPCDLYMSVDRKLRPIVNGYSALGRLILTDFHQLSHGGVKQTINRSRGSYWVTAASRVCRSIISSCLECKLQRGQAMTQRMAPLPAERIHPSPPFTHVSVDLAGPVSVVDPVRRRTTRKVWIAVFCCRATGAVDIEIVDSYSTDSFMLAFKIFQNRRGTPSSMLLDHGTQLTAAEAVARESFHMDELMNRIRTVHNIVWNFSCVSSPHTNGQAERLIGQMKAILTTLTRSRRLTYVEFLSVLSDVESILNSRPYSEQSSEDVSTGFPLTPQHVLGEKASYGTLGVDYSENTTLVKRAANVTAMTAEFWRKYEKVVLPVRVKNGKWHGTSQNVEIGDIVHLLDNRNYVSGYKLARIVAVYPGPDGLVRSCKVETPQKYQKIVSIHILRLIVSNKQ